ncbi:MULTISPECIES: type II secretion system F family protein [Shewanella]|jgi:tight adherence protein C|uniref:Flp pilus assembly protein TadB n=3 Tax=Bacteria TaxID=2 RepID=A0A379ZTE2_9GAMM|nr:MULTISPECIES: type II secretion system F family protein [Shewanella]AXQ13983.1 secretion system protein F [Shewanella algae]MBC8796796.1 type II secretion system F family protein [Shewanella algae]MBO2559174.1 type II secretion system F family protein [Shewanella algae]MBO2563354.1 type II secretion system F family protein [Shewanella algae]MBO2580494.1 type II secretion system F family protein [Shewanella algae]
MINLIILCYACALGFTIISCARIYRRVPPDNREFMDPLSPGLKIIWPLVQVLAFYISEKLSVDYLERVSKKLQISGLSYIMSAEQYFAIRILSTLFAVGLMLAATAMLGEVNSRYLLFAAIVGYFLPVMTLNDLRKKRQLDIVKVLPVYLDYLTMSIEAGLNMTGALTQAVERGPEGPLKIEIEKVIRDMRAGMSRAQSFRNMAERVQITEINSLVSALAQAERTGASLGKTLRIQADQRRVERFQRAEKKALEAPVKLVFPLIVFIFPVTFMILLFPIVMKFMYEL